MKATTRAERNAACLYHPKDIKLCVIKNPTAGIDPTKFKVVFGSMPLLALTLLANLDFEAITIILVQHEQSPLIIIPDFEFEREPMLDRDNLPSGIQIASQCDLRSTHLNAHIDSILMNTPACITDVFLENVDKELRSYPLDAPNLFIQILEHVKYWSDFACDECVEYEDGRREIILRSDYAQYLTMQQASQLCEAMYN